MDTMLWTRCVRRQEKFPKLLALEEIAKIMVSSISWVYSDDSSLMRIVYDQLIF